MALVVALVVSTVEGPLLEFVTAVVMTTGWAATAAVVIDTACGLVNSTSLSLASEVSWALALSSLSDDVRRFEFFTPLSIALRSSCESDWFFSSCVGSTSLDVDRLRVVDVSARLTVEFSRFRLPVELLTVLGLDAAVDSERTFDVDRCTEDPSERFKFNDFRSRDMVAGFLVSDSIFFAGFVVDFVVPLSVFDFTPDVVVLRIDVRTFAVFSLIAVAVVDAVAADAFCRLLWGIELRLLPERDTGFPLAAAGLSAGLGSREFALEFTVELARDPERLAPDARVGIFVVAFAVGLGCCGSRRG